MRVLVLTNLFPNPYQPHRATFNAQQVTVLAEKHDVQVIAPILWTDEMRDRLRTDVRWRKDRTARHNGILIHHPLYFYTPKMLRSLYGFFFLRAVRPAFERALRDFRPDIIFATWAYPDGWAAVELAGSQALPVVVKVHGSDILALPNHPSRRRGTIDALRRADRVVAVSQHLTSQVIDLGVDPRKLAVVYNGINLELFSPGPRLEAKTRLDLPEGPPLWLYVGNLVSEKRLDVLIDACALLRSMAIDFKCYLVGDGPLRRRLTRRVRQLGLDGYVTLHGTVPHVQLPDWYRAASAVILPSRSEGVPNTLLEAAACGTPFIASRVGGIPEIAHWANARLVEPGDPHALADAMQDVLVEQKVNRGPERRFNRSLQDNADDLSALFEELANGPTGQGNRRCKGDMQGLRYSCARPHNPHDNNSGEATWQQKPS